MIPPHILRRIRLSLLLLVLLIAGVAFTRIDPDQPSGVESTHRLREIPFADVSPLGANFFLEREPDPWKRGQAVAMAADAGIDWAKQHFVWADIEPSPGAFEWTKYDEIVDLYRGHAMHIIARVDWPPLWLGEGAVPGINNAPTGEAVEAYAEFAGKLAERYRGRIRFYQIWNEPNLRTEWGNRPVDPQAYVELLAKAARAIRSADPNAVILSAPLAMTTETLEMNGNLSDVAYLDQMYRAGAAEHFDVLSANAFGMGDAPWEPADRDTLNLRRVELQRKVMEDHGDADKAIWMNEYAWNAAPETMPAEHLTWGRVAEETQAEWTVEGIDWAREAWPWAGVFSIWYFQYFRLAPERPEYYFRMVDLDFTPRRVFESVRTYASQISTAGVGEWGEMSAAADMEGEWEWRWSDGAVGDNAVVPREGGGTYRFRFRGTGVTLRAKAHGEFAVNVDGDPVEVNLGRDWSWAPVEQSLPPGEHQLEIAADTADAVEIDVIRVDGPASVSMDPRLLALGAMIIAVVALLSRDIAFVARRI